MSEDHFKGKNADKHILEKFLQGMNISQEPHGIETSGCYVSAIDAARQSTFILTILLLMVAGCLSGIKLLIIAFTLALGSGARSAWMAWARLERLHRMLEEERLEICNNREQERLELKALYQLKGFEEPLLTQVCDVLMADSDRLLKVMLEEELGLTLASHEHPLKLAGFAMLGVIISAGVFTTLLSFAPTLLIYWASAIVASLGALHAHLLCNDRIHSAVFHASSTFCILWILQSVLQHLTSIS